MQNGLLIIFRCIAQPKLAADRFLFEFLTLENDWDKRIETTDYAKKSETWLKQVSAKFKVNNKKISEMKYYIEELADHLKAVLKMRQRIKDRVFRLGSRNFSFDLIWTCDCTVLTINKKRPNYLKDRSNKGIFSQIPMKIVTFILYL